MTTFNLRVFDARGDLRDEIPDFTSDGADVHAEWEVHHNGASRVEIVRASTGDVVRTVTR